MNKSKQIRCGKCRYTALDRQASEYTQKRCKACEVRENCEVCVDCKKRGDCKARINPNLKQSCERRFDTVCSTQILKWAAIQCVCPDSEYNRSLLNVTPNGDRQNAVTWNGCGYGERRNC